MGAKKGQKRRGKPDRPGVAGEPNGQAAVREADRPARTTAPRENSDAPRTGKVEAKRKETIVRQPPQILLPVLLYGVFLIACLVLGQYGLVRKVIIFPTFAVGTVFIVSYVVIALRLDHLKSSLGVRLVAAWVILVILALGFPLADAVFFGEPVAHARLNAGTRTLEFDAPRAGGYMALLEGHFTKLDQFAEENERVRAEREAAGERELTEEEKKKLAAHRQATYQLTGAYKLELQDANGKAVDDAFDGRFEAAGQKRRVSKKGRGYVQHHATTQKYSFVVPAPGPHRIFLSFLDDELSKGIDVTIYQRTRPWLMNLRNSLLALAALVLGATIDHLLKMRKTLGWFTFGAGLLAGWGQYFLGHAAPGTEMQRFVYDLMIGGIIGLVFAAVVLYGMDWVLVRVNRKYKINL